MIRAWLRRILSKYTGIYASRYLVLLIDFMLMSIAFFLTWFIRFNFQPIEFANFPILNSYFFVAFIYLVYFLVFQTYVGIIRYTGYIDTIKIFQACVAAVGTIFLGVYFYKVSFHYESYFMPIGVIVIHALFTLFNLISTRVLFKVVYISLIGETRKGKKNILIYGAGQSGVLTLNTLTADPKSGVSVVGFIDDNHSKKGKSLMGVKIYSPEQVFESIIDKHQVEEVIIAIQNISSNKKSNLVTQFIERNLQVKNVPPIERWINGELSLKQIKSVRIEDLLSREPIQLNTENIYQNISNKTVLISGAAGSIGSEIARQVVGYKPKLIIFVDQAESPMYELELNLRNKIERLHVSTKFIIADVSNKCAMDRIFNDYKIDKIFHAAAYKHVPLMEANPYEAIRVNALGTKNMADLAIQYKVDKFVMISTDKAVNPTNIMGASKRIAEMYIQSLASLDNHQTAFITTRFGNVLGSNGSVIPLFKKQIEKGGPVTVTHPDITRYFMTIPEACQLVLEAGCMGAGGEIYIFDMGESVKIIDVARKMIKLSGLELGKDIQIEISGLRPGEKLYEELLSDAENTLPTHHSKIKIAQIEAQSHAHIQSEFEKLLAAFNQNNHLVLVAQIKSLVKEYVSNNSVYETLD
jgi:FlaA1/EpsC-like NDP-sugar epimerase